MADPLGREFDGWKLNKFSLVGVPDGLSSTLEDGLALSGRRGLIGVTHPPFSSNLLGDDLKRTRLLLTRKGYPEAKVETVFQPEPNKRQLAVTLLIQPGPLVRITDIEIRGLLAGDWAHSREFPIQSEDPFDQDIIEFAQREISRRAHELGYAMAMTTVSLEHRPANHVHLLFEVNLGQQQYFGDVLVEGVPEDLKRIARRSVQVRQGNKYSPRDVEKSEENLRFLGLFRRVHLTMVPTSPDTLDLNLDLLERSHRQLLTGVGYFTDDKLRLQAQWSHNNLFREGRGLGLLLRGTQFEQRFSLSLWKPALIVPRTRGTLTLSLARQDEETYRALLSSATGTITQIWSLNTTLRYGLEVSYNDYILKSEQAVDFEETSGLLSVWVFNYTRETARDRLWPLDGASQSLRVRWAPDYISESQFFLAEPNMAFYRKVLDETIVSGRLRLGFGGPLGSSNALPPNERFFAGGASSHRGFERRGLGPKDVNGGPLGGAARLESALEVRFPLFRSLFGATFVDAGQVWNRMQDARGKDIEVAAGLGIMLKTLAGPLRIDYAWRLTSQDKTQSDTQFHFSIGNPF